MSIGNVWYPDRGRRIAIPLKGDKAWLRRLGKARDIEGAMHDWAKDGAQELADEAKILLDTGGIPDPNHVVSAPGNPANTNTGTLRDGIVTQELAQKGHYAVISTADYGSYVELGTSRMAERPYLRPATAIVRTPLLIDAKIRITKHIKSR